MVAQQRQKKQHKSDAAEAAMRQSTSARLANADEVADGQKREVGRAIEKNRGLTRQRKKIDANPRVKNREKFRKATIRRNGQVRNVSTPQGAYSGEATGIKKNVTHSRRFKS